MLLLLTSQCGIFPVSLPNAKLTPTQAQKYWFSQHYKKDNTPKTWNGSMLLELNNNKFFVKSCVWVSQTTPTTTQKSVYFWSIKVVSASIFLSSQFMSKTKWKRIISLVTFFVAAVEPYAGTGTKKKKEKEKKKNDIFKFNLFYFFWFGRRVRANIG